MRRARQPCWCSAIRPDVSLAASSAAAFRTAEADGRLGSGAPEAAYAFGKMSLRAFVDGLATQGLDEMLKLAQQG